MFWRNFYHWQKSYAAEDSDGTDKSHLWGWMFLKRMQLEVVIVTKVRQRVRTNQFCVVVVWVVVLFLGTAEVVDFLCVGAAVVLSVAWHRWQ